MKKCYLLLILLIPLRLSGQNTNGVPASVQISVEAKKTIQTRLSELLNSIALNMIPENKKTTIIYDSYMQSNSQIFTDGNVMIEDDVNPDFTVGKKGPKIAVHEYLVSFRRFYSMGSKYSIIISDVSVGPIISAGDDQQIEVTYKQRFENTHKQIKTRYADVYRIAKLRAVGSDKKWMLLITSIEYDGPSRTLDKTAASTVAVTPPKPQPIPENPTFSKTSMLKPDTVKKEVAKQEVIKTETTVPDLVKSMGGSSTPAKLTEKPAAQASEAVKTKQEKPMSTSSRPKATSNALIGLQKNMVKYQKKTNLARIAGTAAITGSVAGYAILYKSFLDYRDGIQAQNADLNFWWHTVDGNNIQNGQNFGPLDDRQQKPASFMKFSQPGIYVAGAAVIAGSALWVMSFQSARKAKHYRRQYEQKSKSSLSVTPQWNPGLRYTGIALNYQF